eukprot:Gb_08778 [translate_table: standard]
MNIDNHNRDNETLHIRRILADHIEPAVSESELSTAFIQTIRLPSEATNSNRFQSWDAIYHVIRGTLHHLVIALFHSSGHLLRHLSFPLRPIGINEGTGEGVRGVNEVPLLFTPLSCLAIYAPVAIILRNKGGPR